MENIIQQVVKGTTEKYLEYYATNGICALDKMAEDFEIISNDMAKQILKVLIAQADKAICDAKSERKEDGIAIHERNVQRTLYTALGSFEYERTYFNSQSGKVYILDEMLGVKPYERVDAGVSANLVNTAAKYSYARSAGIIAGDEISRQTAWNKTINTGEVAFVPERAENTPEIIHIFADEDHVSLQNGKGAIIPLVTVCAGKRAVSSGRNELIEPFHVQGSAMDKDTLWEYVYALCAVKFDMDKVKEVCLYGDGATWIKGGLDIFENAKYLLDAFHYKKRMRSLFSGEVGSKFVLKANVAVAQNDKTAFTEVAHTMLAMDIDNMQEGKRRERKIKRTKEDIGYILNHWDAIQNTKLPESIGSCTEAMVSHVLSERFSRNPMGWSKKGLSKLAMIRVYVLNGGKVEPADTVAWKHSGKKHRVIKKIEKYENIVNLQHNEIFNDVKNWRWFEKDNKISGKTTGTKVALDSITKLKKVS